MLHVAMSGCHLQWFQKTPCSFGLQLAMVSKDVCYPLKKLNQGLQLVLHSANFFATCVAMALQDKLQVGCGV